MSALNTLEVSGLDATPMPTGAAQSPQPPMQQQQQRLPAPLPASTASVSSSSQPESPQRSSVVREQQQQHSDTTRRWLEASQATVASSQELQMVADLKSELFHATRQLTQARQHALASEESCRELQQRCNALEVEKQTMTLEAQDARDRLQARQTRLDEHRRDAADAKLQVVSLTAERDELAAKVQEAWDRVAELSAALRSQKEAMAKLQSEVFDARHAQELVTQQCTSLESERRLLLERVKEGSADRRADEVARGRLTSSLQEAVQRLAGVLSEVACNYQQSVVYDGEANLLSITASSRQIETEERETHEQVDAGTTRGSQSLPHVVLSPAQRPGRTSSSQSTEATRVHAEHLLHNAEAAVWGETWDALGEAPAPGRPSTSPPRDARWSSSEATATAATPPERASSLSPARHALLPSDHANSPLCLSSNETVSGSTLSEQAFVRTALAPLLLAMKHVAAMLGTVRYEHRRTTAEAERFHTRYQEVQLQLESVQKSLRAQETESSTFRGEARRLQEQAEAAEAALRQMKVDDAQRRASLAEVLKCREDWALIQHSVERSLLQYAELQKDLVQLRESRRGTQKDALEDSDSARTKHRSVDDFQRHGGAQQQQHYRTAWDSDRNEREQDETKSTITQPQSAKDEALLSSSATASEAEKPQPPLLPSTPPAAHLPAPPSSSLHVTPQSPLFTTGGGGGTADSDTRAESTPGRLEVSNVAPAKSPDPPQHQAPTSRLSTSNSYAAQQLNQQPAAAAQRNGDVEVPDERYMTATLNRAVSRTYPAPLPEASSSRPSHTSLHTPSTAERLLLHSLYGERRQTAASLSPPSSTSPPPLPVAPSVAHPRHAMHVYRNETSTEVEQGSSDQSSMFAAEVLQVIEALDRRVSGALHRAPQS